MDEDSWRRDFVGSFPPPRLRGVAKSDLPRIAELERLAFKAKALSCNALEVMFDTSSGLWLLAEDDEDVWGYSISVRGEEFGMGWIVGMAIHPDRRQRRWARTLLAATVDRLHYHDMDVIRLFVNPNNKIARRLYDDFGFFNTGERDDHFGRGEPRILMSLLPGVSGAPPQRSGRLPEIPADEDLFVVKRGTNVE